MSQQRSSRKSTQFQITCFSQIIIRRLLQSVNVNYVSRWRIDLTTLWKDRYIPVELEKRLAKPLVRTVLSYGAETWTQNIRDERNIPSMDMWLWRRMKRVSWMEKKLITLTTNLAAVVSVCVSVCAQFDQFLPERSHFDSRRPDIFVRIATFPSATFGPLFSFHCPLFVTKNNNLE